MKKVLCGGVFDVLHEGHVKFLEEAKAHGDWLVVVVASDETSAARKRIPVNSQAVRVANLEKIGGADEVIAGGSGDFMEVVDKVKPDTCVFGHDQDKLMEELRAALEARGISIVKLETTYKRGECSTTRMIGD